MRTRFLASLAALATLGTGFSAAAIETPSCDALQGWAAGLQQGETFALREKVEVTTLLRDERVVPLFGAPVEQWSRSEVTTVRKRLNDCRSAASRTDEALARRLYDAIKALDSARGPLTTLARERQRAVDTVERLLASLPDPRLPGQIALTRDALEGLAIAPERYGLQREPNWIRHVQHARGFLNGAEIADLVERLETGRTTLAAAEAERAAEREAALAKLRRALDAAPEDPSGLQRLAGLERSPLLRELPAEAVRDFQADIRDRRQAIEAAIRAEQRRRYEAERAQSAAAARARAEQARAERAHREAEQQRRPATTQRGGGAPARRAVPASPQEAGVEAHLSEVLEGDRIGELTLVGLSPGMAEGEAIRHLRGTLGYQETMSPFFTRAWGRGAAFVEFRGMDDRLGQLDHTEYFRAAVDSAAVLATLAERFGPPDEVTVTSGSGRLTTWHGDGQSLQVFATNVLHPMVRHKGFAARTSISLWSDDYDRHLTAVNARCAEIRSIPRNQWSMDDSHYFGVHCPMMPGAEKTAGVQVVE